MCKCEIAGAQLIEHTKNAQTGPNRMATLDANQAGNLARSMGLLDARGRGDQRHVMGIELHEAAYQIDLLQGQLHCIQMLGGARRIGGPELGRDHALFEAAQVRVAPGAGRPGRHLSQIAAKVKVLQLILEELAYVPGQIVVAIDQGHLLQHVPHTLHAIVEVRSAAAAAAAAAAADSCASENGQHERYID